MIKNIITKIKKKKFVPGVLGLGYVGLPLAELFLKKGLKVIGYDISEDRIKEIKNKTIDIEDIDRNFIAEEIKKGNFALDVSPEILKKADGIFICVPTPVNIYRIPDLSYIEKAGKDISRILKRGQLVILKSTTYPETTEKVLLSILQSKNMKVGKDFFLAYVPERINPGDKKFTLEKIPVVLSGVTRNCTRVAEALYKEIVPYVKVVSSPRVAEMTKLFENIFRNINIALSNQMALLCDRMGINFWEVIEAAKTKPFGFMPFYPGPGVGGHCIPVDPYYLSYKAKEYDIEIDFITLAAKINDGMPYYVFEIIEHVILKEKLNLENLKVLVMGISFKKNISDIRNSPALKIFKILTKKFKKVDYYDPFVPYIKELNKKSISLSKKIYKNYDMFIILVDHNNLPYSDILQNAEVIVDTRGVFYNKKRKGLYVMGTGLNVLYSF
jgi:UDP-N-acetyl-D-glucosamine dehydrogenase